MPCKYCGQNAQGRLDEYGEEECQFCHDFFMSNPTPPVPAPTQLLVNLNTGEVEIKVKKEK